MGLTARLSQFVDGGVRRRGGGYFARGAVSVMEGAAWSVLATVRGGNDYVAYLKRRGKTVQVSCTCPYFETYVETCKHIWATLLAAEGEGYLRGSGDSGPSYIEADGSVIEEQSEGSQELEDVDDDVDEYEPYSEPKQYQTYPPPHYSSRPAKPAKRSSRPSDWKQHLATLRGEMQKEDTSQRGVWPPGRQLIYVIDVPTTLAGRGLVVDLAFRQRKKDGEWSKPRFETIYKSQVPLLPD